jgi:hypothetical protein
VPRSEPCSVCRQPTTGISAISGKPVCAACKHKPYTPPTLAALAARPAGSRPARPPQCRRCYADETHDSTGRSSLAKGVCRDVLACEERQPPLFTAEVPR